STSTNSSSPAAPSSGGVPVPPLPGDPGIQVGATASEQKHKEDPLLIKIELHGIFAGPAVGGGFQMVAFARVSAPGADEIGADVTVGDGATRPGGPAMRPGGGPITVSVESWQAKRPHSNWITSFLMATAMRGDEAVLRTQWIQHNWVT